MTQTNGNTTDPRSRRAVLAAAAGAVAASAVATLGRPVPATAADGDPLTLGQDNQADTITRLDGTLGVTPILEVFNDVPVPNPISITAINGFSANGEGVLGTSEGSFGLASSGVRGVAAKRAGVGVSAFNVEGGLALHVSGKPGWPPEADERPWRPADRRWTSTCARMAASRARRSVSPTS